MPIIITEEYPTETNLKELTEYNAYYNYHGLLDSMQYYFSRHGCFKKKGNSYYLATGGWSGCEDIIGALQKNYIFWGMCWQKSARGGAYWFKVPKIKGGKV